MSAGGWWPRSHRKGGTLAEIMTTRGPPSLQTDPGPAGPGMGQTPTLFKSAEFPSAGWVFRDLTR